MLIEFADGYKEDETLGVQKLDWDHPDDLGFQLDVIIAADVVRTLLRVAFT